MRDLINRPEEQWALLRRSDKSLSSLAVFVHGFVGNYLSTWGRLPELIHENADAEPPFSEWDYLFIGYSTSAVETYLDIAVRLETFLRRASSNDRALRRTYKRFALFGHSLGALGIRQFLCATVLNEKLLEAVQSVSLFGCPIDGSPLAGFGALLFPKIASALKPDNPQLRMLRTWAKCGHMARPWPLTRLIVGGEDMVIGDKKMWFVEWPNDDRPTMTNFDHRKLVKPIDWSKSDVVDFIGKALE
jgi:pimeloyl-ACP methyl ester carboxylesterase